MDNDTSEQKWREEFEKHLKLNIRMFDRGSLEVNPHSGKYLYTETHNAWNFYLSARKKAHSENEDAFKAFTLDLADRYEKEIELLKAELKAERLQNDKTLEFIDKHDHIDISWFPLNFDLEETVKNRRIVL